MLNRKIMALQVLHPQPVPLNLAQKWVGPSMPEDQLSFGNLFSIAIYWEKNEHQYLMNALVFRKTATNTKSMIHRCSYSRCSSRSGCNTGTQWVWLKQHQQMKALLRFYLPCSSVHCCSHWGGMVFVLAVVRECKLQDWILIFGDIKYICIKYKQAAFSLRHTLLMRAD